MKAQNFRQRNLLLHSQWKWLVTEFVSFYGVSDAYTKLRYKLLIDCFMHLPRLVCISSQKSICHFCRYLSYVMDVATPTADCLLLIHDLLAPVISKGSTLSHQEVSLVIDLFMKDDFKC